jgi:hypothetical protein
MPSPSQPFSAGRPATAAMMSRLISSRSVSSASMVKGMPKPAASVASASTRSIKAGTQRSYWATS